jgi:drug/metabolite transporter (DMT)-like permease
MRTRPLGVILIILGIVMMAYTGFNFVTREKVVDIGPLEIEKKENNPVRWSPIVGLVLLIGGVVVLVSSKGTANSNG